MLSCAGAARSTASAASSPAPRCWRRWKLRNTAEGRAYHAIPTRTRVIVAAVYLGLVALLGLGVFETFLERGFGDV